ncbi:MAG TPA: FKBP-type peptidyl-prolyl cis-trans isomerase [Bryobacteraceae bacterium]|nr:FKBP-type peptidyl-prolyl cis-trans isomerase [Bryobacteraceae bacterium]
MLFILLPIGLAVQGAWAQAAKPKPATATKTAETPAVMTDDEKTIYALGLSIYRSLGQFDLSPSELAIVEKAMSDAASGKPAVELNMWGPKIQPFARARATRGLEREKAASQAYIDKAAAQAGAVKTDSGLIYRELRPGTGPSPTPTDTVKVNYRGTLVNGTEFDSSYSRNEPAQFALNGVIPCWTEGLQKMKVGGKAELVCPSSLAYGDGGRPSIPGGAALIFEVELLEIAGANPPAPPAPVSPPAPPAPPPSQ